MNTNFKQHVLGCFCSVKENEETNLEDMPVYMPTYSKLVHLNLTLQEDHFNNQDEVAIFNTMGGFTGLGNCSHFFIYVNWIATFQLCITKGSTLL